MTIMFDTIIKKIKTESTINCFIARINMETANEILKTFNTNNRMLYKSLVTTYADRMLRGIWKLNGEPLIFGTDEKNNHYLLTGQHRLQAIVSATIKYRLTDNAQAVYPNAMLELTTVVIHGVDVSTADTIDSGKTRSHTDILFRNEWLNKYISPSYKTPLNKKNKWCRILATAARVVWLRSGGASVSSAPKFDHAEMISFIENDHEALANFTNEILLITENNKSIKMPIPYCIGLSYVATLDENGKVNDEVYSTIMAFLNDLVSETPKSKLTINLHKYWNKLLQTPGSKDRDLEWTAPYIKVLNALLSNKTINTENIELTLEEKQNYTKHPILLNGWDTSRFELAAERKARVIALLSNKELKPQKFVINKPPIPTKPERQKPNIIIKPTNISKTTVKKPPIPTKTNKQ